MGYWAKKKFGSTEVVNDLTELTGFINDFEKSVREQILQEHIEKAEDVFRQIRKRLPQSYPYIFRLSKAGEGAAQWERYANGGQGVAIVFRTEALKKLFFTTSSWTKCFTSIKQNITNYANHL